MPLWDNRTYSGLSSNYMVCLQSLPKYIVTVEMQEQARLPLLPLMNTDTHTLPCQVLLSCTPLPRAFLQIPELQPKRTDAHSEFWSQDTRRQPSKDLSTWSVTGPLILIEKRSNSIYCDASQNVLGVHQMPVTELGSSNRLHLINSSQCPR